MIEHRDTTTPLHEAQSLIANDFNKMRALLQEAMHTEIPLIHDISQHIAEGGKRIRPTLALLIAKALGYNGTQHIDLAVIIEYIHTATLLHDDVVDNSTKRRGKDTANTVWGNEACVLVGDFLYSRAFQLLTDMDNQRLANILASASNVMAESEVLQLLHRHNKEATESIYFDIIYGKTAVLFEAAAHLSATLCQADTPTINAMKTFGQTLGIAFQLIDDALDYSGDTALMGKNIGDDLREGKPTLPLIYALQQGNETQRKIIETAIITGNTESIDEIMATLKERHAIEYTEKQASHYMTKAIEALGELPDSPYKKALHELTVFTVKREH